MNKFPFPQRNVMHTLISDVNSTYSAYFPKSPQSTVGKFQVRPIPTNLPLWKKIHSKVKYELNNKGFTV